MFPEAPVFTTIVDRKRLPQRFASLDVRTSFLQRFPTVSRNYAAILPLMPQAFKRFDLREFDLVISSSHAFSKAVTPRPDALHICYCHTPLRYAWSHQDEYLRAMPTGKLTKGIAKFAVERLRKWDETASKGVDAYIANSENVRQRIQRYYRRVSTVVYPPVDLRRFKPAQRDRPSSAPFLVVSRLFSYKRVHMAVEACNRLGLPLVIVGRGPELRRLRGMAGPTVRFVGEVDDLVLASLYNSCRAVLFTADEDFGLVPLEAMASGRPVLALDAGGAKETVVNGVTGTFYPNRGVNALVEALRQFSPDDYDPIACRRRAEEFSIARFRHGISEVIERELGRSLDPVAVLSNPTAD